MMEQLTHLSLFSGIGGLDLAAEWAGMRTIGQCEWAEYPTKVLERHWPDVPRWRDIRTLTEESFHERTGRRTVDVISGGFPCQPFSFAGKQRGKEDDRYLWPEMARVIKELRPAWVVGENVAGIIKMALPDILSELEAIGYRTRTFLVPACAVGARHRRYRVAIVAHSGHDVPSGWEHEEEGCEGAAFHEPAPCGGGRARDLEDASGGRCGEPGDVREQQRGAEPERPGEAVADPKGVCPRGLRIREEKEKPGPGIGCEDVQHADSAGCKEQHAAREPKGEGFPCGGHDPGGRGEWQRTAEPGLGGMAHGIPDWVDGYWDIEPDIPRVGQKGRNRVDRIKALGNAVVPEQFFPIFEAIEKVERMVERNEDE